ncbi:MAG: DNA-binding protein [Clostridia bacterium]|nr:DNA-binding protein [Clostridia bacterium]
MFEKNLRFAYLLDFYGSVLDEHTEAVMKAYYDDDLSLSEVAAGVGISRQGVRHVIKRGEEQLEFLEERLGLAKGHENIDEALAKLRMIAEALPSSVGEAKDKILELATVIEENN